MLPTIAPGIEMRAEARNCGSAAGIRTLTSAETVEPPLTLMRSSAARDEEERSARRRPAARDDHDHRPDGDERDAVRERRGDAGAWDMHRYEPCAPSLRRAVRVGRLRSVPVRSHRAGAVAQLVRAADS